MYTCAQDDILQWAATYEGEPYHAVLCDPPYHLTSITKRFGKPDSAPAQHGTDGAFARAAKGFMGRNWDGGDIAFRPETWYAIAQHLYPGGFGMAFAGSRGWHRMATAIEDAGLILHPTIFCWNYHNGFPKATRIDTQIDRLLGAERAIVGKKKHAPKFDAAEFGYREKDNGYNSHARTSFDLTAPGSDLAHAWEGHRYGLQALKPAVEPIMVFQRPYEGRPIENMMETGAGALWIEGGRISLNQEHPPTGSGSRESWRQMEGRTDRQTYTSNGTPPSGRWPANLILCHHPLCTDESCADDCAVLHMERQSGERPAGSSTTGDDPSEKTNGIYGTYGRKGFTSHADSGTASRFYENADWMLDRLEAADAVVSYPKPTGAEREAGLDPLHVRLMRELYGDEIADFAETTVDDGREKPIDNAYLRGETTRRNTHPTIKPISLNRYLATLLLPPSAYPDRRLLVPFSGAGSEVIGGMLAGWETVHGIELEADHVAIATARLRYWQQQRSRFDHGQPIRVRGKRKADVTQGELF